MVTDRDRFLKDLRRGLRRERVVAPRRKAIVADVAARLDEAAVEAGIDEAVRDMGDPAETAREYAALEREHPIRTARWGRGLVWAAIVLVALLVLQVLHIPTFGVIRPMDPQYGGSFWQVSLWPLMRFWGDSNQGYVFDASVGVLAYVLLPGLAFLLASSFWRAAGLKA